MELALLRHSEVAKRYGSALLTRLSGVRIPPSELKDRGQEVPEMTPYFIVVWLLVPILYTIYAWYFGRVATISSVVGRWAQRWPFLPWLFAYAVGVLAGHLFWPQ